MVIEGLWVEVVVLAMDKDSGSEGMVTTGGGEEGGVGYRWFKGGSKRVLEEGEEIGKK